MIKADDIGVSDYYLMKNIFYIENQFFFKGIYFITLGFSINETFFVFLALNLFIRDQKDDNSLGE